MQPKIYLATDHDIDPSMVDPDALYVLSKLREAGFAAYLVGGSVRDLLSKQKPKDFDISTSALPEEIKAVFRRNCILIGRRFRLAHIRFGKKIIEVATFRSGDTSEDDLIIQDNRWGTSEEDALRRDFTLNGLFYDPFDHQIIDYVGGWDDIHKGILRTIGNPNNRFKQDPVRMIRLIKFKARFGFHIEPETLQALQDCKEEIIKSSPARILEEMLRMMESGHMVPFFHLMAEFHLLNILFPSFANLLEELNQETYSYLSIIDQIHQKSGPAVLERSVIFSALLLPILEKEIEKNYTAKGSVPHLGEIALVVGSVIKNIVTDSFSHFPRRLSATTAYILTTQYRLIPLSNKRLFRHKTMQSKEFNLALRLLQVRALVNSNLVELYRSWRKSYRQQEHHGDRKPHPHKVPTFKEVKR